MDIMSTNGRTLVGLIALLGGLGLLFVGSFTRDDATRASGTAITGAVVGYAFGDRNGEKRSASALAERGIDADALNAIAALLKVSPAVPVTLNPEKAPAPPTP